MGMTQYNPSGSQESTSVDTREVLEDLLKYLGLNPYSVPGSIKFDKGV